MNKIWSIIEGIVIAIIAPPTPMEPTPLNPSKSTPTPQMVQTPTSTPNSSPEASSAPQTGLLQPFCNAIGQYEGGNQVGSRPYRNCNPGDLRWPYGKPYPYGATGIDDENFLIFPSHTLGMAALTTMITNCCEGKSKIYHPTMTLIDFFNVYAPSSDNNDPNRYAEWVASTIGVAPTMEIAQLLA